MSTQNRNEAGLTRRSFLAHTGVAAGAVSVSVGMSGIARATSSTTTKTGIFVNQRGGCDGLTMVAPVAEAAYQSARTNAFGTIAIPQPGVGARDWLDSKFALAPSGVAATGTVDMIEPYLNGDLVFVHGAGWVNQSRSHFTAMLNMEHGVNPGVPLFPADGWGGRYVLRAPDSGSPVRGFAHGNLLPTLLRGAPKTSAVADAANLGFPGPDTLTGTIPTAPFRQHTISKSYQATPRVLAMQAAEAAFSTLAELTAVTYPTPGSGSYPDTPFGNALANTAAVIKDPNVHVEVIHLDIASWDHHQAQQPNTPGGVFYEIFEDLSVSVGAFYQDLQAHFGSSGVTKYLMMIFTEFGRQIAVNADLGTDHGYGSVFTAMGAGVNPSAGGSGGTVFHEFGSADLATSFDPLNSDALDITIDYRDIWREALENQLCLNPADFAAVFPGFTPRVTPPGIIG